MPIIMVHMLSGNNHFLIGFKTHSTERNLSDTPSLSKNSCCAHRSELTPLRRIKDNKQIALLNSPQRAVQCIDLPWDASLSRGRGQCRNSKLIKEKSINVSGKLSYECRQTNPPLLNAQVQSWKGGGLDWGCAKRSEKLEAREDQREALSPGLWYSWTQSSCGCLHKIRTRSSPPSF